jgi:hypothetical protein
VLALVALAIVALAGAPRARADCGAPANAIVAENCKAGTPASQWDVSGAGDASIQGFATDISVNRGQTVHFKVDTTASEFRLEIYRMGWYRGDGARLVDTIDHVAGQSQPPCATDASTGLVHCDNWAESAAWNVPSDATSGIYFAKLVRESGAAGASHVVFVVRSDASRSDLLFQTSDTTWQAYNDYGGHSLYSGGPGTGPDRAYKVSYDRPFHTRDVDGGEDWVFNSEYPMVRFLERNGYDVSYLAGADTDRDGALLRQHRTFLSVGHDEYWSGAQRASVQAARDAGVNLAFFSGNEIFWKTRWEDDHRTLVSYKETHAGQKIDPSGVWTGSWRDPRPFNPEGGHPENALSGEIFMVNSGSAAMQVPAADGKLRFWRNTSIATLGAGQTATLTDGTVGYEWDEDLDNGARPAGLIDLSTTQVDPVQLLLDYGSSYGSGDATHHLTLYRAPSGALVFGAGTVQWPWGLDDQHDRGTDPADPRMQQATVNLLADMGDQPGSLQTGLAGVTQSTDHAPPVATITAPAAGAALQAGKPVTIAGTAADAGGGVVGGIEVSVDGATWHPASGRASWSYTWTPTSAGTATVRARASDDSANLGAPATQSVTVGGRVCPCTIFGDDATPAVSDANDGQAIEAGTKFRADADGYVTGLRYFKGAGWTGTRTGHLWSGSGQLLGTATFTAETSSGWQEARLPQPVALTKGATYVASYLSSSGDYASTSNGLADGVDAPPLHALADGVFRYGDGFPTQTSSASNYWADVVFDQAPTVTAVAPGDSATGVGAGAKITATFDRPLDASTVTGATFTLRSASGAIAAGVSYDAASRTATLTPASPLAAGTVYTATVRGGAPGVKGAGGLALAADRTWSFTTAAAAPPSGGGGSGGSGGREPSSGGAAPSASGPLSAPGPPASPPPPASDRTAPRIRVSPRTVRVSAGGRVALRAACPRGERRCRVLLRLRLGHRYVAAKTLTVTGGRSRVFSLKLTRAARRELARKGSLKVVAFAAARDAAGNRATTKTSIRLRRSR